MLQVGYSGIFVVLYLYVHMYTGMKGSDGLLKREAFPLAGLLQLVLPENLFKRECVIRKYTKTPLAPPPLPFLLPLLAFLLLPFLLPLHAFLLPLLLHLLPCFPT